MASHYIAVDLGGTQIRTARYSPDCELEQRFATNTHAERGFDAIWASVEDAIDRVWLPGADGGIAAIGLGAPGPMDYKKGILRFAPNLPGWNNVPLHDMLTQKYNCRVFVGNDADLAALAESKYGSGRDVDSLIYLTISTGIGGGLVFHDRLFTGGHGLGGEVGHMGVDPRGPVHSCGNRGCLEVMASGRSIARRAQERLKHGETSLAVDIVNGDLSKVTAKVLSIAGHQGDDFAISAYREAGSYIGSAIVSLMFLLNPSLFVLGGSVTKAGDLLMKPILETIEAYAPLVYREQTRVILAELGEDVVLYGALALCLSGL
ncbi:MAG: ROK family protein [Anaerolineae bacterium]|nr:ROK family protein [Anaerolineae bacterium]